MGDIQECVYQTDKHSVDELKQRPDSLSFIHFIHLYHRH